MDKRPHYAIMRISKIHNYKVLAAVEKHNMRKIPAGIVAGRPAPIDWIKHEGSFSDRAEQVLQSTGAKWDKGKILAVEILVTASPDWWKNASSEQKAEWITANFKFAQDQFGPGLISFAPHLDESTLHVQFVGLPLYSAVKGKPGPKPIKPESIARRAKEDAEATKIWRLSYHEKFGGDPERLAELQTRYHSYVAHLGLQRGNDTRGLNIKHQTLKEYKLKLQQAEQKLFEQQQAIDVEWAKIAETQAMLDHYDQQLAENHRRFAEAKAEFGQEQLEHFAKTEEFRVREEAFAQQEQEFGKRLKEHDAKKSAIAVREANLEQRDAQIQELEREMALTAAAQAEERQRLEQKLVGANTKESALDDRERDVAQREMIVTDREVAITEREQSLQTTMAQVAILGRIITGKIVGTWNRADAKPEFSADALTPEERKALSSPLPPILGEAMRLAVSFAEQRQKLRARAKKALTRLFNRKAVVTEREASADTRIAQVERREQAAITQEALTERNHRAAEALLGSAAARIAEAESAAAKLAQTKLDLDSANSELESVRSQVRNASAEEATAQAAAKVAQDQLDAARADVDTYRADAEAARSSVIAENAKREQIEAALSALETEKASVQREVETLRAEGETLNREKLSMENERAEFEEVKDTHSISANLLASIFGSNQHARMMGNTLEVFRPGQIDGDPQDTMDATGFAPWLPALVGAYEGFSEQRFKLKQIEAKLTARYRTLADRYPEKRAELQAQFDEDEASAARIRKSSLPIPEQQGGMGG